MRKRRPSLPIGHTIGNLASIRKALHADDRFEVYELDSGEDEVPVLLLCRGMPANSTETSRLSQWWASQASSVLREAHWLSASELLPNASTALIKLRGLRLDASSLADADDSTLRRTLYSLLDLAH